MPPKQSAKTTAVGNLDFDAWLVQATDLRGRSLRDLVCRAKRARGIVDLTTMMSKAEVDFRLAESVMFQQCAPSVQSQLRRAAHLYVRFLSGEKA